MGRRDGRRRYEEEVAAARSAQSPERDLASEEGPEHVLLPLQRSAGNQAVGAMLDARSTLARQPAGTTEAEPMDAKQGEAKGKILVKVADIGEFDALSIHLGPERKGEQDRGGKTPAKEKNKTVHESVTVTKNVDKLSADLHKFAIDGKARLVEIEYGPISIRIADAVVENYQQSSGGDPPMETITFNGTVEVTFKAEGG